MTVRLLSAGVVVVKRGNDARRYLLLRAFNYWDFPKGVVEPGEDPMTAACREVEEETGITDLAFVWGDGYHETGPYRRGKVARYYVALSSQQQRVYLPINPELGRPEHHEFRWVTYPQGLALVNLRLRPVLEWAHVVTASKVAGPGGTAAPSARTHHGDP